MALAGVRAHGVIVSSGRAAVARGIPIMSLSAATGASACSSARTTTRFIAISWRANAAGHGVAVFCLLPDAQPRSSHSRHSDFEALLTKAGAARASYIAFDLLIGAASTPG